MQQTSWTITKFEDGQEVHTEKGVSSSDALVSIRHAMYGDADAFLAASQQSVHELALVA